MLKVGDKVTWLHISKRGKQISMETRKGQIKALDKGIAAVKWNNRSMNLPVASLRPDEQTTQLAEFVESVVKAANRQVANG